MVTTRKIKRYSNRKLYDMTESRYVTLDEVARFVQEGDEVLIVDNRTKEDITSVTLAQIVYEQEKKKKNFLPLNTLKGIIRSSGQLIQRTIATPMATIKDDAEHTLINLMEDADRRVATMKEEVEKAFSSFVEKGDARPFIREIAEGTRNMYEDFSDALDERYHQWLRGIGQQEESIERQDKFEKRLAAIERRLKTIESRLGHRETDDA